jgi:hypothetical protein
MKKNFLLVLAVGFLSSISYAAATPAGTWEELSNDDGIQTWRKEIEGSDVVAFKGQAVIDAPIAKVANILIDTSRKKEWVHRIVQAKDIRPINEYERIEYNHTASGVFIVRDRDFVFHAKAEFDRAQGLMVMKLKSVDDALMPESGPVRGQLNNSVYTLRSVEGGKKTHFTVEIHADPKGSVPKWLVNLFQKAWPRNTIANIRKQAAKPDVVEHPGVKAYFEGTKDIPASAKLTSAN